MENESKYFKWVKSIRDNGQYFDIFIDNIVIINYTLIVAWRLDILIGYGTISNTHYFFNSSDFKTFNILIIVLKVLQAQKSISSKRINILERQVSPVIKATPQNF